MNEAMAMKNILNTYATASGQVINLQKFEFFCSRNVPSEVQDTLANTLDVRQVLGTGKYLGLPSMIGRNRKSTFKFIKDRIWHEINSWSSRHLSQAGREVMIKFVLQSIPSYIMSIFLIPSTLIADIEKMLNSFWWGKNDTRGLHWLSWERLSVLKEYGGMGFKSLQAFNYAMLGKQAWKLVTSPDALITKLLKARYFPTSDFFQSRIGHNPSYVWRSIWRAKFVVQGGSKWNVGTGDDICVWNQKWLRHGGSLTPPQNMSPMLEQLKVKHIIRSAKKAWNQHLISNLFDNDMADKILDTPLLGSVRNDILVWQLEQDGGYSVRSAYKFCVNNTGVIEKHGIAGNWNQIWRIKTPPKVKSLLWHIARNCLSTRKRLAERGVPCPHSCAVCNNEDEDSVHILFLCQKSIQCWQKCGLWDKIHACIINVNSITTNLLLVMEKFDTTQLELFSVMLWSIWQRRNNQIWKNVTELSQTVCDRANNMLMSWRNVQQARRNATATQPAPPTMSWTKPSTGRYKCNIDASFSNSNNKVGIGICIRDDQGSFVLARTEWVEPILDIEIGEALGLLKALTWVNDLQLLNIVFEMDCKRVVDSLYSKKSNVSELGTILKDCKHLLSTSLANCHVKFIRRQANEAAHSLAKVAPLLASSHIFIDIPTCIQNIILNEMR